LVGHACDLIGTGRKLKKWHQPTTFCMNPENLSQKDIKKCFQGNFLIVIGIHLEIHHEIFFRFSYFSIQIYLFSTFGSYLTIQIEI